jgi:antirestriction protein ArdC
MPVRRGGDCRDMKCEGLEIEVHLVQLGSLPESSTTDVYVDGGAAYRRSTSEILIDPSFLIRQFEVQTAVLAHEAGHAVAHHNNLLWDASDAGDQKAEEFIADRLACEWGFESGLAEERRTSYGLKYVEALENWRDEKMYRQKMNLWRLLHDAGIA